MPQNKTGRVELWDTEIIGSSGRPSSGDKMLDPKMDFATQASGFAKGRTIRPDSDGGDDYDGKTLLACASSEDGEIDVFCIEEQQRTHTVMTTGSKGGKLVDSGLVFCRL